MICAALLVFCILTHFCGGLIVSRNAFAPQKLGCCGRKAHELDLAAMIACKGNGRAGWLDSSLVEWLASQPRSISRGV